MRKKYKPNFFNQFNPEWIKRYLLIPILTISTIILLYNIGKTELIKYLNEKQEEYLISESERLESESIYQSESYERYLKESKKYAEEEKQKIIKEEAVRKQKVNTEYENKIFSQYWKKGTYVYDKVNDQYGVVDHCEIPHVITKEGWYFIADESNDYKNKDITQVGWIQWHNWTMKELNKKGKKESERINTIILEELRKREEKAIKIFPKNPKYGKVKYNTEYYYIIDWKNGKLKLVSKDDKPSKPKNFIYVEYDDKNLQKLNYNELMNFYVKES